MRKSFAILFIFLVALAGFSLYISTLFPATITSSNLGVSGDGRENIPERTHEFGPYTLQTGEVFEVFKTGQPDQPILRFEPDQFVGAAHSNLTVKYNDGSFSLGQEIIDHYMIRSWDLALENRGFEIDGKLGVSNKEADFTFRMMARTENELTFDIRTNGSEGEITNLAFRFKSPENEHIYGFGEQYNHLDMQGRTVPVWVEEQGVARGKLPDSILVNLISPYSSGDWYTTYAPVPYFITNRPRALVLNNHEFSVFDFKDEKEAEIQVWSSEMSGHIFTGETMKGVLQNYTSFAGRMPLLPGWVNKGAIVQVLGGSEKVRKIADRLQEAGVPVSAFWIEDWLGPLHKSSPDIFYQPDRELYPDWENLVSDLRERGIRVLIYFNPYLIDTSEDESAENNLYRIAKERGYFVKNREGEVYPLDWDWYSPKDKYKGGIIDLTNSEARMWFKNLMKEQLELGVSGWMADFGEYLPTDARLHSGTDSLSYHNRYPVEWAKLNREAIEEAGMMGEAMFFTRSGFTKSPSESTLFWTGDQLISWGRHDGIKTVVPALLSSGLSGFSLNHPDIGGYHSYSYPFFTYHRSKELMYRWTELATFTAVFRSHSGSEPEKNLQVHSDNEVMDFFARFAKIYRALAPYRENLMREAWDRGLPIVRHLVLHYPDDPEVYDLKQEFMYGSEFLVRPVVSKGVREVSVYLPEGRWTHLWTGEDYGSPDEGTWVEIEAPIGEPAVFYREGSEAGRSLVDRLENLDII